MSAVDSAVSSISAASTNSVEQNASNDNRQHYHNTQQSNKLRGELARAENDDIVYLGGPRVYSCIHCRTHLTTHDDVISKSFHGKQGRALLIDQCVNVLLGRGEDRLLMTGMHKVADLKCKRCENVIGWTYLKAYERSQKYKEGKYIIEKINLYEETNTSSHWTPS